MPSYLYSDNVSPLDRFDQITIVLDSGQSATLRKGFVYNLTDTEVARTRKFAVMSASSGTVTPITRTGSIIVIGNLSDGDIPVWDASLGAFVPGQPTGGGGGGGGGDAFIVQDPDTGYPARGADSTPKFWIGWDDPTSLMAELDMYVPIPAPS